MVFRYRSSCFRHTRLLTLLSLLSLLPFPPPSSPSFAPDDYTPSQLKEEDHFGLLLRTLPPPSPPSHLQLTDKTLASHVAAHRKTAVVFYISCESVPLCSPPVPRASSIWRVHDLCLYLLCIIPYRGCEESCVSTSFHGSCRKPGPW